MAESRVPDDHRDWNAMDIFVFTNGQQYSPPRKYHLCSDDLNIWESTIRFIAHSQYGSLHSNIELYTIDGRKVGGALELSNDAAYVAVKPPDAFVEAGYDKYLLKASRSWEKRQGKLSVVSPMHEKVTGSVEVPKSTNQVVKDTKPNPTKYKSIAKPSNRTQSLSKDLTEKRKLLAKRDFPRKGKVSAESSSTKNLDVGLSKNIPSTLESDKRTKDTDEDLVVQENGIVNKYDTNDVYKNPNREAESMLAEDINIDQNKSLTDVKTRDVATQSDVNKLQTDCMINLNVNIEINHLNEYKREQFVSNSETARTIVVRCSCGQNADSNIITEERDIVPIKLKMDGPTKIDAEECKNVDNLMMYDDGDKIDNKTNVPQKISLQAISESVKVFEHTECTQTDWCDVLLEAKHNPGGYTFHLPSIRQLKDYQL